MRVEMQLWKVKKFGIVWCIPQRMAADNDKGRSVRTPPPHSIGLIVYYATESNGQIILKANYGNLNSSKKRTKKIDFTTMIPQVDLFSFVFWRKLKASKRHFEIKWPLVRTRLVHVSTLQKLNIFWMTDMVTYQALKGFPDYRRTLLLNIKLR